MSRKDLRRQEMPAVAGLRVITAEDGTARKGEIKRPKGAEKTKKEKDK